MKPLSHAPSEPFNQMYLLIFNVVPLDGVPVDDVILRRRNWVRLGVAENLVDHVATLFDVGHRRSRHSDVDGQRPAIRKIE